MLLGKVSNDDGGEEEIDEDEDEVEDEDEDEPPLVTMLSMLNAESLASLGCLPLGGSFANSVVDDDDDVDVDGDDVGRVRLR